MTFKKINPNQELLSKFAGQDAFITTPRIYYQLTKCLNKSYLLNQIVFYTGKSTMLKDGWFYKTYEEWCEELFLTDRTLRSYFKEFVKKEWIDMRIQKINGIRTPLFRANTEKITLALLALNLPPPEPSGTTQNKQPEQKPTQTETISELDNHCTEMQTNLYNNLPKRKKLPDSQTENFSVSYTIDTDNYLQKKLTTVKPNPSSSSFFSEKQKAELLTLKLSTDTRTDELFLEHCTHHVENQKNDLSKYQKFTGVKRILTRLNETGCHFKATGFDKVSVESLSANEEETRIPTEEEWKKWKNCEKGFDWVGGWMQKQKQV